MIPSEKNPPWGRQLEKTLKFVGKKIPSRKRPIELRRKTNVCEEEGETESSVVGGCWGLD